MKRILVIALILLIALLFLYAAYLDGVIAFAMSECEFCKFLETYDLEADILKYPTNTQQNPLVQINYELALFEKVTFKAKGAERAMHGALRYNIPLNYCPECGRQFNK